MKNPPFSIAEINTDKLTDKLSKTDAKSQTHIGLLNNTMGAKKRGLKPLFFGEAFRSPKTKTTLRLKPLFFGEAFRGSDMQYCNKFSKMPYRRALVSLQRGIEAENVNPKTKKRKEAIEFYQKYGLNPALDAFHISRSTLFKWQQKFRDFGRYSLVDRRHCPRNNMEKVLEVFPFEIKRVQTDNGLEFDGAFDRLLKEKT